MRNLKKFLALVLALMMTFSLMVTANAAIDTNAAVTDKDSITEEFKEAVAVLNGLKIITGYEDSTFRPDKSISRQEAAALVYRLHSGDADNVKKDLYSTADNIAKFKDVDPNGAQQWSAGYIGYCANQEIIKGVNASRDRFNPTGNVTGYQMLAMVLRAIGYGQRGEYEGDGWQTRVATTATQLGMLKNIDDTNYAGTLSAPATRELVAEIVFQAALLKQVIWNDAFGYVSKNQITGLELKSLGVEKFNLNCGNYTVIDKWGRPGYQWFKGSSPIATIKALPVKTYDTTVRECDVAHDLGIATNATYSLYVNRNTAITDSYRIEATDTVTKVGGQGRITEFYGNLTNEHNGSTWSKSVVMIDTYLATVTKVTERVLDPAGHVIVPAYLYLDVYDGHGVGPADKTTTDTATAAHNTSEHRASRTDANWEYSMGDKVLLNGYTNYTQGETSPANVTGLNHESSQSEREQAAFETNRLMPSGGSAGSYATQADAKIDVLGKAEYKTGKQTVTYWNQAKHTVDNVDYNDAMTLFLDVAGTTTGTTFAWYFDAKGNLIGIDNVPNTVNYGVITSIYSAFNQGESATDGTAKAIANVLYADGTTGTVTIDRFLMSTAANNGGHGAAGDKLTDVNQKSDVAAGAIELIPMYDYSAGTSNVMMATQRGTTGNVDVKNANQAGVLHVAPVVNINAVENGSNAGGYYGILRGNMFKFVGSPDGGMTAVEVAGASNAANHATNENTGIYEWNYNDEPTKGMIYKSYGYVALDADNKNGDIWLDSDTRIMVRGWDGTNATNTVNCYTLATLPGNVDFGTNEIDWSDPDGDGRADYVYVTGTIEGTTTYGLFYYNGGAAQWNGVDGKGTAFGWLNGEPTTITFDDETEFNLIRNSQAYRGHLFALQLTNNVVSNVMGEDTTNTAHMEWLLNNESDQTAKAAFKIGGNVELSNTITSGGVTGISGAFGLGSANVKNGNPYTANTEVVYMEDTGSGANDVKYNPANRTIVVGADTYYLTPNSKVVGLGMSVNQEGAILDYLNRVKNDVTIVYEEDSVKSIVEIYVATDPDNTSSGEAGNTVTFGSDITKAPTNITASADLANWLKGFRNGVFYSATAKTGTTAASEATMLYFPFVTSAANMTGTLEIKDSSGAIRFVESATIAAAGSHFFSFDFANAVPGTGNSGGWSGSVGLTAGAYSYAVYVNGTDVVSSGTFTLVLG